MASDEGQVRLVPAPLEKADPALGAASSEAADWLDRIRSCNRCGTQTTEAAASVAPVAAPPRYRPAREFFLCRCPVQIFVLCVIIKFQNEEDRDEVWAAGCCALPSCCKCGHSGGRCHSSHPSCHSSHLQFLQGAWQPLAEWVKDNEEGTLGYEVGAAA